MAWLRGEMTTVRACDELRSAINGVDHAPTELVLTRQCADVSKLMYHMRINGDLLDHDLPCLVRWAASCLRSHLPGGRSPGSFLVAGDHRCRSWGAGTCALLALPAFVASRIFVSSPCGYHGGSLLCSHWGPLATQSWLNMTLALMKLCRV